MQSWINLFFFVFISTYSMSSTIPCMHFDFEGYTGNNTIVNKGSGGTNFNGTFYASGTSSSVTSDDFAVGTSCLNLIGNGTSSGGYVAIPSLGINGAPMYNINLLFISFWYKKSLLTIGETNARIFEFYNSDGAFMNCHFNSTGCLVLSHSAFNDYILTDNVCDNRWHHIALSFGELWHHFWAYTDGFQSLHDVNNPWQYFPNTYTYCYLGKSRNSSDYFSSVKIDDFRMYNTVLSDAEVYALFSCYSKTKLCNFYFGNPPVNISLLVK